MQLYSVGVLLLDGVHNAIHCTCAAVNVDGCGVKYMFMFLVLRGRDYMQVTLGNKYTAASVDTG